MNIGLPSLREVRAKGLSGMGGGRTGPWPAAIDGQSPAHGVCLVGRPGGLGTGVRPDPAVLEALLLLSWSGRPDDGIPALWGAPVGSWAVRTSYRFEIRFPWRAGRRLSTRDVNGWSLSRSRHRVSNPNAGSMTRRRAVALAVPCRRMWDLRDTVDLLWRPVEGQAESECSEWEFWSQCFLDHFF